MLNVLSLSSLSHMDIFMSTCYPNSCPPLLFIFERWLRKKGSTKGCEESNPLLSLNPLLSWTACVTLLLLELHTHSAFLSFVSHPPRLSRFTLLMCWVLPFITLPHCDNRLFFYPLLSPSSPQAFPSLPIITASSVFESIGFINIFSEKMPFSLISQVRWKLICQSSLIYCAQQLVFNYGKAPVVRWRAQTEAFPFPAPSMAKLYSPSWLFF